MPKKPSQKPSYVRKKRSIHAGCSKKRTILKDRIRQLEQRVDELVDAVEMKGLAIRILKDDLDVIVEAGGWKHLLDPFGSPKLVGDEEIPEE